MIKVSSKVEAGVWDELRGVARESGRSIASLLTEAIREYLDRRRVRPVVLRHLQDSVRDNAALCRTRGR